MDQRDALTEIVIGAAIEVHRELGPGLLESVYQRCMEHELHLRGQSFRSQQPMPLAYKGVILDAKLVMDIYFPDRLVVELKAVDKLVPIHESQLLTYMKMTNSPVGLLINFNVQALRQGVKRMVL